MRQEPVKEHAHTNALINEASPYLLQHAHNPVDWFPWGEEALEKARSENKLIIVSIGYSSCHWCHVMERESFEDAEVAGVMNELFVSIKVDREERPDLDHLYMTAVQLLHIRGGWPLNCIALPDGRPIWGGTYFPRSQWIEALKEVDHYYRNHPGETEAHATSLERGIRQQSLVPPVKEGPIMSREKLQQVVENWASLFDPHHGGQRGAPKFPMPANLEFLLHYAVQCRNSHILEHVDLTLNSMARGGIFDQAGGGFARYSVDEQWRVPHFEKMLYDNAQLIGLYASAFKVSGRKQYRQVVRQCIGWVQREMRSGEGLFYSAMDADSEGKEGSYYVWGEAELKSMLGADYQLFADYYQISDATRWEEGTHILYRNLDPEEFADQNGLDEATFRKMAGKWNTALLEARSARTPPALDDKSLTSWNSLMISGLVKAYHALGDPEYLDLALHCAGLIRTGCLTGYHHLCHVYKSGKASIPGFHIDYSLYAEACIDLYMSTMDTDWLDLALKLTSAIHEMFPDEGSGMFRFNSGRLAVPVTNQVEIQDNVIPSSNSVMGHNLFRLGHLTGNTDFLESAANMVRAVQERFEQYPYSHANWGRLILMHIYPFYEVAITGEGASEMVDRVLGDYQPNLVVAGTRSPSDLPLFRDRFDKHKSLIFVCRDHVCELPYTRLSDAKGVYHMG